MLLFLISFLLVFTSSYLIVSALKPKENSIGFIYLFLIAFAQIILTFEILSLFSAINQTWFLAMNGIFLGASLLIWQKYQRPAWRIKSSNLLNRIINSLKLDKSLSFLAVGFSIFVLSAIFLCIIMPVNNKDALAYHLARCLFWIKQGNLNHFLIADVRNICLPINSELLYSWILLFFKKDIGIGFFAFIGYIFSMTAVFNILGLLGYCIRKRLWVIFILTSLPSILIQASTTETDIIIAALVSSSLFLFWYALKNNQKAPVYMASLAYAIAIGTKPTAIMMIPAVGIFFSILSIQFKNYKLLLFFLVSGVINFFIFSSFNYILNYLDFSNFVGFESYITINKNYFGIRGAISNIVKHAYMFVDFTGFKWGLYLHPYLKASESQLLNALHIGILPDSFFTLTDVKKTVVMTDVVMGAGVLGFLVFIPCVITSLFRFKIKLKKHFYLGIMGLCFLINIFVVSYLINYSTFNVRYLVAFIVLSSPVLIYSYGIKFKPLKLLIILFALYSLVVISLNIKARPFFSIIKLLNTKHSIAYLRKNAICVNEPFCIIDDNIKNSFKKNNKILIFDNVSDDIYLPKMLEMKGYVVDFNLLENISTIDFNKYNLLIIKDNKQEAYVREYINPRDELLEKGVSCHYEKPSIMPKPCFMICQIGKKTLLRNNFQLIKTFTTINENKIDRSSAVENFFIYENKNNPRVNELGVANK